MKYDISDMDVQYVQSLYPSIPREVIIRAMIDVRINGYSKEIGIIEWFHRVVIRYKFEYDIFEAE